MSSPRLLVVAIACALLAALPAAAHAQDPDIIRGRVTGPDSLPIQNATITATAISTNATKTAKTDKNGIFSIPFPNAEGDYWVNVAAVGFNGRRFEVKRLGDEDVLVADVRLGKAVTMLGPVQTIGRRPTAPRADVADISGAERTLSMMSVDMSQLGDMAALASMIPGVTYIPGVDGGPGGFSIYGLDPSQNSFFINGMLVDGNGLPRDAQMQLAINTSPFGQAGNGANITGRGGSGGNVSVRTMSFRGLTPQMQWSDQTAQSLGQEKTRASVGGRIAGPITMNKLYYNVSYQFDRNTNPLRSLLSVDDVALTAAGMSRDSVDRLRNALASLNIPFTVSRFPDQNTEQSGSLLGQFDFSPPTATAQSWRLSFNGNWSSRQPSSQNDLRSAPATSSESRSWSGNVGLTHVTYIRNTFLSTTTAGFTASRGSTDPFLSLPNARIRIASELEDGIHVSTIGVGASPSIGSGTAGSTVQLRNSLKWISMNNLHTLTLSSDVRRNTSHSDPSGNLLGSFYFNSLADFEAGIPASFSRTLTPLSEGSSQLVGGVGLSDQWRVNPDMTVTFALRADGTSFGTRPERNPLIEETFGVRNDIVPRSVTIAPSVRFSKMLGTAQQLTAVEGMVRGPRWRMSGGLGLLQGQLSAGTVNQAVRATGLPSGIQQLSCSGTATPEADWAAYLSDLANVPDHCADGTGGSVFASNRPSVTLMDPKFRGQRSFGADLVLAGPILNNRFRTNWQFNYRRNYGQTGSVDLNFNPTERFTLLDEGGRPVFVEPTSIVPTSGIIAVRDARISDDFNRVTKAISDLHSYSRQMSLSLSPVLTTSTYSWSMAYTYQWNRREVMGFESTVGNPLDRAITLNSLTPVHELRLNAGYNIGTTVRFQWGVSARSGAAFTPRVIGDVNGDGVSGNDRPFIFDPSNAPDATVAAGMRELLEQGSPLAKKCLSSQIGTLVGIGSCRGPWTLRVNDLSANINPLKMHLPQRARLTFSISNPIGALDMLVNGSGGVKGWGQTPNPEQTLMTVRGFDPTTRRYTYEVNPRFGSVRPQQSLTRSIAPVTLNALLSLDIGVPRERQTLNQTLDRGRRDENVRATEAMIKSSMANGNIINPMTRMLQQADLLKLSVPVADSLSYLNRWFTTRLDSIWTPVAHYLSQLPNDYDRGEAYSAYKIARESSYDLLISIAPGIIKMLTSEQRRLLGPTQQYLDLRYLRSLRSSTAGTGGGGIY